MTRKQHIVTRSLLANFVDTDGALWVYERSKAVRKSRPTNECHQRDFYEYQWKGRTTNNRYENWLARVESDAMPLLKVLIERRPLLQSQALLVSSFVASLFLRTRKYRTQVSHTMVERFRNQTRNPEFIRDLQYDRFRDGDLPSREDLQKEMSELLDVMDRSPSFYHVVGLRRHTKVLAQAIMQKSWCTIEAPPGMAFITSDCPVATAELVDGRVAPGVGFGKENTAVFLPLTPQHVFVASRVGWGRIADVRFIHSMNNLTVHFAHRNVYANANSTAIQLLVDTSIDGLRFGENAFLTKQ